MIYRHDNYRSYLRAYLEEKIQKNPQYSLRAFARQLDLAPGFVSDVLRGNKNISLQNAGKVVSRLKLNSKESSFFQLLLQLELAKDNETKIRLSQELESLHPQRVSKDINLDVFRTLSDWHHTAILEIANTDEMKAEANEISRRLGVSRLEAQTALDRMHRLGLLENDPIKGFRKKDASLVIQSENPNEGLRRFHRQMLERAINSLETQTPKEKRVGSETFSFDPEDLEQANQIIEDCFTRIVQLAKKSKNKKHIYHLGIQLFKLDKGSKK